MVFCVPRNPSAVLCTALFNRSMIATGNHSFERFAALCNTLSGEVSTTHRTLHQLFGARRPSSVTPLTGRGAKFNRPSANAGHTPNLAFAYPRKAGGKELGFPVGGAVRPIGLTEEVASVG